MGAETPVRRKRTAREMAVQLGASERTVRNIIAEPRSEFLDRAATKRTKAVKLREHGHTYAEIAATMHLPIGSVGKLLHDARKHDARKNAARNQGQASA